MSHASPPVCRTIDQIIHLDEGCRTPEEQQRLDQYYATRTQEHTALTRAITAHGVYFPGDPRVSTDIMTDLLESIRQKYQMWR